MSIVHCAAVKYFDSTAAFNELNVVYSVVSVIIKYM